MFEVEVNIEVMLLGSDLLVIINFDDFDCIDIYEVFWFLLVVVL